MLTHSGVQFYPPGGKESRGWEQARAEMYIVASRRQSCSISEGRQCASVGNAKRKPDLAGTCEEAGTPKDPND